MSGSVLLVLLLAGCGGNEGAQKKTAAGGAPPPPEVNVVKVGKSTVTLTRDLPGRLEARRTAQVRARVDGIVEKRLFLEGSDVKAGQTLYRIDARTYQAAYDSARADEDVAQKTMARYKPLLDAKAVSQQDYDLAEAKLEQARAALAKARLDLDNTRVPAPISGRIGRTMVTEGALVGHGNATLMTTIEQVDPIYANFTEPGADLLRLRHEIDSGKLSASKSRKVELVLGDGSVYPLPGRLLFEDLAVDPGTGSVSLRAKFPNPKHELLPGMFVRVRFSEATSNDSIKLPQRAVLSNPQGQFVMVVDAKGKVAPHPVTTGGMAGGDFIIASGLKGGEQVIVDGLQKVRPGATVKPVLLDAGGNAPAAPPAAPAAAAKK
jgi:membrane fusion protein (multidrug efflux system)